VFKQTFAAILFIVQIVLLTVVVTHNDKVHCLKSFLTQAQASHFAQLALKCVTREFPNNQNTC